MQTTVTLDGYNVVISTLAKEITLVNGQKPVPLMGSDEAPCMGWK
jgi:hypothetical protein